jgi:hypothetical protein
MAERDYERDDVGRFAGVGASVSQKHQGALAKLGQAKKTASAKPDKPAAKVGRKTKGAKGEIVFYSFGDDVEAEQLGSWDLAGTADDPTGSKNVLGSHIGNIATGFLPGKSGATDDEIAEHVTKRLKLDDLKPPPGHEVVYRLASTADGLVRKNGGNLRGVLEHAYSSEDRGVAYGTRLTAYAVKMPKEFNDYEYLRHAGKEE